MQTYALSDFQILRPRHETLQEKGIEWLASAHAQAEKTKLSVEDSSQEQEHTLYQDFLARFKHIGCKPEHISKRGHELSDFLHQNWSEMEVFRLDQSSSGVGLSKRLKFHAQMTDAVFEKYYSEECSPPNHLIHVSCTGYSSPSSAQKIVSRRGWGDQTLVTHAYHMGCYASIPAIRMGGAFVQTMGGKADIVHTELCTLHFNPDNHQPDQIVLQSLFADGYIKYSVAPLSETRKSQAAHMQVVTTHEQILPDSSEAMTWELNDWGFGGTLSRKIPFLIARNVGKFIETVAEKVGIKSDELMQKALFAVHPGGPKILDHIQEILKLQSEQLRFSRKILLNYGNVSSGTLPHIWEAILADENVADGTWVMSLAFGPGLNIAGALLIKN